MSLSIFFRDMNPPIVHGLNGNIQQTGTNRAGTKNHETTKTKSKFMKRGLFMENNLKLVTIEKDVFSVDETCTSNPLRYSTTGDDVKLFNSINGGSEPVADYIDNDIEISDIVITSAEVAADPNDDESETVSKPCAHFICTNGKHLATLSNGIIKACKNLLSVGFAPTPENPITVHFKTIKTKKGIAHTFDLVKR